MIIRNLLWLLLFISFFNCTDKPTITNNPTSTIEKMPSGLSIENGRRQGSIFVDSNGTKYTYRHITVTITNDSLAPMRIIVDFSTFGNHATDSLKSKVFLLPRRRLTPENKLTPLKNQVDLGITEQLQSFLDRVAVSKVSLDTILGSKGKCVMTFGILTDTKYAEPFGIGLKSLPLNSATINLGLAFDKNLIPCGQITFTDN